MRKLLATLLTLWASFACAQDVPSHAIPIGRGPGSVGWASVGPCNTNQSFIWSNTTTDPTCVTIAGGSVNGPGSSTVNHLAIWNNTLGTLLADTTLTGSGKISVSAPPFVVSLTSSNANTFVSNVTGSSAAPTDNSLPSCSTSNNFLQYTSGTGLSCATTSPAPTVLFRTINVQVFTASGTYTPVANMLYAQIECWGAGGGGGGTASAVSGTLVAAAGGGAGSYSKKTVTAATVGASQTVTIGAAGTAGASGNNAGGNGGDTSVGSLCVGKGGTGGGGNGGTSTGAVNGAAGGIAGTGDITTTAQPGQGFINLSVGSGASAGALSTLGGSSSIGGGGATTTGATTIAGSAGTGHASGGGGAGSYNAGAAAGGGAGTAGYVVITEFTN